ncbi:MAG: 6-bladed beta-propeller, partial [archaeon]|nr:6-bladed beta-propeller [archaeon]
MDTIGSYGTGSGQFNTPKGVAVNRTGFIYVTDFGNHRIQVFSSENTYLFEWGEYGTESSQFNCPVSIAINRTGYVYVVDSLNNRIQTFSHNGTFIRSWGGLGVDNGKFYNPQGITINSTGHVYVSDTQNHRIQIFDDCGNHLQTWGDYYKGSDLGDFNSPIGIAVNETGHIFVTDTLNNRVQVFDSQGNFQMSWGSLGSEQGEFSQPSGIAINRTGDIYVSDTFNHRIQVFSENGSFLSEFGEYGTDLNKFRYPYQIALNHSNYICVADSNNHRIQIFQNPPQPSYWNLIQLIIDEDFLSDSDNYLYVYGQGTLDNPYIVKNIQLIGNGTYPLVIVRNVSSYLQIHNLLLINGSIGTVINNSENVLFYEITSQNHTSQGLSLYNSTDVHIYDNTIHYITGPLISAVNSSFINITGNNLTHSFNINGKGIYFENSNSCTIQNNDLDSISQSGITLNNSNSTTINLNSINSINKSGIIGLITYETTINNNNFSNIKEHGIWLSSTKSQIANNNLDNINLTGFSLFSITDSSLEGNEFNLVETVLNVTDAVNITINSNIFENSTSGITLIDIINGTFSSNNIENITGTGITGQNWQNFNLTNNNLIDLTGNGLLIDNYANSYLNSVLINITSLEGLVLTDSTNLEINSCNIYNTAITGFLMQRGINCSLDGLNINNVNGINQNPGLQMEGGTVYGIRFQDSINSDISSSNIYQIYAGKGSDGNSTIGNGEDGGIANGISFSNTSYGQIENCNIYYIYGGLGGSTGVENYTSGNGGGAIGVSFSSNSNNNIINNNDIQEILGGNGGNIIGVSDTGGAGGDSIGIFLENSIKNTFNLNTFEHLRISNGNGGSYRGSDGNSYGFFFTDPQSYNNNITISNQIHSEYPYYSGYKWYYSPIIYCYNQSDVTISSKTIYALNPTNLGAIVVINCSNVLISSNNIRSVNGKRGKSGKSGEQGESGGDGVGIFLLNDSTCTVQYNSIWSIYGGQGGTSGQDEDGPNGGQGIGIYCESVINADFLSNNYYVIGGNGGNAGNEGSNGGNGGNSQAILTVDSLNITQKNQHNHIRFSSGGTGSITSGSTGEKYVLNLKNTNNTISSYSQTFDHSDSYNGAYTALVSPDVNSSNNIWSSQYSPEIQSTFNQTITFSIDNAPDANMSTLYLYYQINGSEWTVINVSGQNQYEFNESEYIHNHYINWYISYNTTANLTKDLFTLSYLTDDIAPDFIYNGQSGYDTYLKAYSSVDFDFIEANTLYSAQYKWEVDGTYRGTWTNGTIFVYPSNVNYQSGGNTLYYKIRDLAGNWNTTTLNFTIDLEEPVITLISPINYYAYNSTFPINFSVTDNILLSTVHYNWDNNGWQLLNAPYNFTAESISEGTHTLYMRAYDAAGNMQLSSYEFIVDQTAPTITIYSTQDDHYAAPPQISYLVSDTFSINDFQYQIDNTSGWYSILSGYSGYRSQTSFAIDTSLFNSLSNSESHTVYFRADDDVGNLRNNTDLTFSFFKDVTAPHFQIITTNDSYYNMEPNITVEFYDNLQMSRAYYKIDSASPSGSSISGWTSIFTGNSLPNYTQSFIMNTNLWNNLEQGTHTIYFKAFDEANTYNDTSSVAFSFLKDDIKPQYTCNFTNQTIFATEPPTLNFTFSDDVQLASVYYQIDSYTPTGSNATNWINLFSSLSNSSATKSISFNSTYWSSLPQGYHKIYFKIRDHIDNFYEGSGANFEFFKDTIPPDITFNIQNYTYYNEAALLDIDVVDSTGLDSAYYQIDVETYGQGDNVTGWIEIVANHSDNDFTVDFLFNSSLWDNLTEGEHVLYIKAWDDLGNKILTPSYQWIFYKDLTEPTYLIDSNELTNYTVYRENPKIYSKFTDLMGGNPGNLSAGYFKIDSPLPSGQNLNGWTEFFSNVDYNIKEDGFIFDSTVWNDLDDGNHTLYIKVFDDAGNLDDLCTQSFIFEKDSTGPEILLINATNYYSTIDTFDVNISIDTLDAVGAQYKWNNAAEYSNFTTDFLAVASSLPEGINTLWVKAWDEVSNPIFPTTIETGNINIQSYQFIVDQSAPNITFITDNNTIYNSPPTFNVNFWDNFSLDSAYYVIDIYN